MIHYLSLRINAQATEDTEKVRSTVKLFLPPHKNGTVNSGSDIISESVNKGHYGNQIITMEVTLNRKKQCQYVIELIKQRLGKQALSQLITQLPQRVDDDCNLYIKFDKQHAYQDRLIMTSSQDYILLRIKLEAYPARYDEAVRIAQTLFSIED